MLGLFLLLLLLQLLVPCSVINAFVHPQSAGCAPLRRRVGTRSAIRALDVPGMGPSWHKWNAHMMCKSRGEYHNVGPNLRATHSAVIENDGEDDKDATQTSDGAKSDRNDVQGTDSKSANHTKSELGNTKNHDAESSDAEGNGSRPKSDPDDREGGVKNNTATVNATSNEVSAIDVEIEVEAKDSHVADAGAEYASTKDQEQDDERRIRQLRQRARRYASELPLSDILRRLDRRGLRYSPSSSQEELEIMLADALVRERSGNTGHADTSSTRSSRRDRPLQSTPSSGTSRITRARQSRNGIMQDSKVDNGTSKESQYDRRRARRQKQIRNERLQEPQSIPRAIRDVAKVASRAVEPVDRVVSEAIFGGAGSEVTKRAAQKVGSTAKKVIGVTADVAGTVVGGVGEVVGGVKEKATGRRSSKRVIRVDENGIADADWSYVWQEGENDGEEQNGQDDSNDYRSGDAGMDGRRRAPRRRSRRRPTRPAAPFQQEPNPDDGDEFTWADYAIPFHVQAGPPGDHLDRSSRREGNSRQRRRRPSRSPNGGPEPWNGRYGDEVSGKVSPSRRRPARSAPDQSPLILPPASSDATPFPSTEDAIGEAHGANPARAASGREETTKQRRQRRRRDRNEGGERKIYSAWPDSEVEGDIIDQFGNKVADAAEAFLWGDGDDDEGRARTEDRRRRPNDLQKRDRRRSTSEDDAEEELPPIRHWRDRIADRLDAAMGVHEQGSYYQEWADRIDLDKDNKIGTDPEDWVMGKHKNQRRMGLTPEERRSSRNGGRGAEQGGRRGKVDKYFWSQDGTIMSALLGRTPTGQRASVDKLFAQPLGPNVVTTLLRSAFQLSLASFANVCRWASVRGSLPQPIVVFFVSIALTCAPRGKRILSGGVTLLALRSVAEALHGYIYGDNGWEDDPDHLYYDDDDGVEGNGGNAKGRDDASPDEGAQRRGHRRNSSPYPGA